MMETKFVKVLMEFLLYLLKFLEVEGMDQEVIEVEAVVRPPLPTYMQVVWTPQL
jgi:hypothetical protein